VLWERKREREKILRLNTAPFRGLISHAVRTAKKTRLTLYRREERKLVTLTVPRKNCKWIYIEYRIEFDARSNSVWQSVFIATVIRSVISLLYRCQTRISKAYDKPLFIDHLSSQLPLSFRYDYWSFKFGCACSEGKVQRYDSLLFPSHSPQGKKNGSDRCQTQYLVCSVRQFTSLRGRFTVIVKPFAFKIPRVEKNVHVSIWNGGRLDNTLIIQY